MRNKLPAIGLVAGLTVGSIGGLALGVPGLVGAQTTTTTPSAEAPTSDTPTPPSTPDGEARPARGQRTAEALAPLVADGTLTQAQADAVIAALDAAKPAGGGWGHRGGLAGPRLDAAAEAIGIEEDALLAALRDGQTLAQVAEANGTDAQAVVDALVAEARTRLDREVAEGELTQAEADEKLASATERLTALVDGELPAGPGGRGPAGRGPGGPGRGGPGADDSQDAPDTSGATTSTTAA